MSDHSRSSWCANSSRAISKNLPCSAAASLARGGVERPRVHPLQRQVAPHIAQVVAEMRTDLVDRAGGAAAERALEVAVLHQRERGFGVAADVVALGVDGPNQLETDGFGRADPDR